MTPSLRLRLALIWALFALVPVLAAAAEKAPPHLVVTEVAPVEAAGGAVQAWILLDRRIEGLDEAALTRLRISPDAGLPLHIHPEATEIVHVLSGGGELTLSGASTIIGPGDTLLIPAGVVHGFTPGSSPVEGLQIYVPGGPEQRFLDPTVSGTVPADRAEIPDPGTGRVVTAAQATPRESHEATFTSLLSEVDLGDRTVDLLKVASPAGSPADVHPHDGVSELIYVLKGNGTVTIDGARWDIAAGGAFYTPEGSTMGLASETDTEVLVLVVR